MKLEFRAATESDLPELVSMLADDELGAKREDISSPLVQSYVDVFREIELDPNNELVTVFFKGRLVGMLQLTFIPYLTYKGSWRCLIEGVRIHRDFRGQNVGSKLFAWAINRAKERSCRIIQLTTDKKRPDALRFYEKLGFLPSHEGMKLHIL